jgi:hypothetical protein
MAIVTRKTTLLLSMQCPKIWQKIQIKKFIFKLVGCKVESYITFWQVLAKKNAINV